MKGQIHTTPLKIDLNILDKIVYDLHTRYQEIGHRDSKEGRSRFCQWNNINKFYERLQTGEIPSEISLKTGFAQIQLTGSVTGDTERIYYKPSVTSLGMEIRKAIVPIHEDRVFVYFDIKAAEFMMNNIFCGNQTLLDAYRAGEDVYMHFAEFFPKNTPRKVIKEALIANMYGMTAYTLSKRVNQAGIPFTENKAEILLDLVRRKAVPFMEAQKVHVVGHARLKNAYFCPNGFDQKDLVKVSEPTEKKPFSANRALSSYVQSALGIWMQRLMQYVSPRCASAVSVFDSIFAEISPENLDRFKQYIIHSCSPLIPDKFITGKSMYDAQHGTDTYKDLKIKY